MKESVRDVTAVDGACPIEMEGGETVDHVWVSQAPASPVASAGVVRLPSKAPRK
jgi:hypothetical protein